MVGSGDSVVSRKLPTTALRTSAQRRPDLPAVEAAPAPSAGSSRYGKAPDHQTQGVGSRPENWTFRTAKELLTRLRQERGLAM